MTSSPPATDVATFGPHSASWRFFGGWHGMLMGLWSGSMQNVHHKLGEAVWEHSDFFVERWQRLMRSLYPIIGVVFDPAGASGQVETGHEIRDYHRDVMGTMPDGSRLPPAAHRLRMHPRARHGWDRATGRLAPDTPPVETPARNLPPRSEWGSSMHSYCPVSAVRRADLPWERTAEK